MAFSDTQTAIADELARSNLTNEVHRETNNAIMVFRKKVFLTSVEELIRSRAV